MPYSSADDSNLPSNVKKLPSDKRRQWIAVFNSAYKKSGDDGAAMRQANGAVKEKQPAAMRVISRGEKAGRVLSGRNATEIKDAMKRLRDVLTKAGIDEAEIETQVKAFGQKCGYEVDSYPDVPGVGAEPYAPAPYGGATSFDEIQAYEAAHETAEDLSELTWKFQAIFQNIMADDEMTPAERAAAITRASADFATAAQDPEAADTDEKSLGIMKHIRALFGGSDGKKEVRTKAAKLFADAKAQGDPSALIEWFNNGADGQIDWGSSGDFDDCVDIASDHMDEDQAKGFCNLRHQDAVGGAPGSEDSSKESDDERGAFASFKDAKGQRRWMATWSNNFYDRDGEVFPESAHKEYINYVDQTGDFPELWLWHVPGSKAGKADFIDYDDGMCIASGTFDDDMEYVADALARTKDLAVSHGYTYDPMAVHRGAITSYRTFEISPLPVTRASNLGTAFAALKEAPMLTAQKRQWLAEIVGPEKLTQIEENNRRLRKELADKGISYKEFVDALGEGAETPTPPPQPPSQPNPPTPPAPNPPAPPSPPTEGEGQGDGQGDKAAGTIFAPGFKSEDGGKTWVAHEAKAEGDKAAPADDFRSGLKEAVTQTITEALAPVMSALKEHDTKLDALKASDDEKIAGAWSAKRWDASGVKAASDSPDNVVDANDERTKELIATATKAGGAADGNADPARPYVEDLQRLMGGGGLPQG